MGKPRDQFCTCIAYGCRTNPTGGCWLTYAQRREHEAADSRPTRRHTVPKPPYRISASVEDILKSMDGLQVTVSETEGIPTETSQFHPDLELHIPAPQPNPVSPAWYNRESRSEAQVERKDRAQTLYRILFDMDEEVERRWVAMMSIMKRFNASCSVPNFCVLEQHLDAIAGDRNWILRAIQNLETFDPEGHVYVCSLKAALLDKCKDHLSVMDASVGRIKASQSRLNVYDTDRYLKHRLLAFNPIVLGIMLLAIVLNLLGNAPRNTSNFFLQAIRAILEDVFAMCRAGGSLISAEQKLIQSLPKDIRSARKAFDLEADITIYACCPLCSAIYAPDAKSTGKMVYPALCTSRSFRKICGKPLLTRSGDPVRPYPYRRMPDFIASMLTRSDVEDVLEASWSYGRESSAMMTDIWHGSVLSSLPGPDGAPFSQAQDGSLRLAWSLSIDWFNPFSNKAAGRTESVGSIAMLCLNLPPSLRYRAENIYLVGIIPGPNEPSLHQVNFFLKPLIDELLTSWSPGVWLTRTHRHPKGRRCLSALICLVCDLPAARKVGGTAGHQANCFCNLCLLTKKEMGNRNTHTWTRRSRAEYLAIAMTWRDASTKRERDAIYKQHGIRWSEFLRLPYWDPFKFVVVDAMHAIFIGLFQHHCRRILKLSDKDKEDKKGLVEKQNACAIVSEDEMEAGPASNTQTDDDVGSDCRRFLDGINVVERIQQGIAETLRPSWQTKPPSGFGTASNGKLKADEWR